MPDTKPNAQPRKGIGEYGGKAAGIIGVVLVGFIGYLWWEHNKATKAAAAATPTANVATTSGQTTALTVLTPQTTIANATPTTEVYPISVTDPGALTIDDFNYGVSTSPQFQGEQGITYAQYEKLVG